MSTFTCPVCYDPYTNVLRKAVACSYCAHEACTLCVKQHLLLNPQPCCMSCNAGWNRDFIDSILTKTWRMGALRQHRQDTLIDRERSLLPATQARITAERERAAAQSQRYALMRRLQAAQDFLDHYARTVASVRSVARWVRDGRPRQACAAGWGVSGVPGVPGVPGGVAGIPGPGGVSGGIPGVGMMTCVFRNGSTLCNTCVNLKCVECLHVRRMNEDHPLCISTRRSSDFVGVDVDAEERRVLATLARDLGAHEAVVAEVLPKLAALGGISAGPEIPPEEKQQRAAFVRACPVADCRGFLSTAWKCGMCATWVCPQCHEVKGAAKDAPHACNPEMLESARLIEAETKPCPSCASRISRVSGCDQMFCTACNKPFSWRTGRAISGPVHNPHFFEWQRRRAGEGGAADQLAANAIAACGDANNINIPSFGLVMSGFRSAPGSVENSSDFMMDTYQRVTHIHHVEMDKLTRLIQRNEHTYETLREIFLHKGIDEAEWKRKLFLTENDTERAQDMLDVLRMYVSTACDLMRQLPREGAGVAAGAAGAAGGGEIMTKQTFISQHAQLKTYARDALVKLSARYGTKTPGILADRL
jgi:hypothetical protein